MKSHSLYGFGRQISKSNLEENVVCNSSKEDFTRCTFMTGQKRYNGEYQTEWEFLKDVLMKNGVPADAVLKEDQATFTWENAKFSRKVTDQAGINIRKAIICCKNYHARRALMYYQRAYPDAEFRVCPCCVDGITRDNWTESERGIKEVLAEVNRIVTQFSLMM